jgi:hypothetical protein
VKSPEQVFSNRSIRYASTSGFVVFAIVSFAMVVDGRPIDEWFGLLFLAVSLMLIRRAFRGSTVIVSGDEVCLRSLLITRRLPMLEVQGASAWTGSLGLLGMARQALLFRGATAPGFCLRS